MTRTPGRKALPALISRSSFCFFAQSGFNPFNSLLSNAASIVWPLMRGLVLLKIRYTRTLAARLKILITVAACLLRVTSKRRCAAPLAILMAGQTRGSFHRQTPWLMAVTTLYAVAFFILSTPTRGMVHTACRFIVPLLSLYNGQRGRHPWLGRFFHWHYPGHMFVP